VREGAVQPEDEPGVLVGGFDVNGGLVLFGAGAVGEVQVDVRGLGVLFFGLGFVVRWVGDLDAVLGDSYVFCIGFSVWCDVLAEDGMV
jgi:hypothetical protein